MNCSLTLSKSELVREKSEKLRWQIRRLLLSHGLLTILNCANLLQRNLWLGVVIVAILLLLLPLQYLGVEMGLHHLTLRDRDVDELLNILSILSHDWSLEMSGDRNTGHGRLKIACLRHACLLSLWLVEVLWSIDLSLGDLPRILHPNYILMSLNFNPSLSLYFRVGLNLVRFGDFVVVDFVRGVCLPNWIETPSSSTLNHHTHSKAMGNR